MKEKVYDFLRTIPKGKVVIYGQIAEYLGNLSKQFAFGGIEKQKEKLEKDGIGVINYKVNLDEYKML